MANIVKVTLTHSASKTIIPEKRYDLHQTIESIKANMYGYFGTPSEFVRLDLYDANGIKIASDMSGEKMLGYYQCRDEYRIHCVDSQPSTTIMNYDDLSQVEKFEISEEEWLKRGDNVRGFKQQMIAKMQKERDAEGSAPVNEEDEEAYKELASAMNVGDRCCCQPGDRLGCVRYVGKIACLKPGYWVGVEFDEPVGKSNGTVKGNKVFECQPLYGGFLRPNQVETGDFPLEEF